MTLTRVDNTKHSWRRGNHTRTSDWACARFPILFQKRHFALSDATSNAISSAEEYTAESERSVNSGEIKFNARNIALALCARTLTHPRRSLINKKVRLKRDIRLKTRSDWRRRRDFHLKQRMCRRWCKNSIIGVAGEARSGVSDFFRSRQFTPLKWNFKIMQLVQAPWPSKAGHASRIMSKMCVSLYGETPHWPDS